MNYWLFKEEPSHYSWSDLVRDGKTVWDGVDNNLARIHLRTVRKGDRALFYHTGDVKAIVGEMRIVGGPRPDDSSDDEKAVVVDVEPVRAWPVPLTLSRIKADSQLQDWQLVRNSRLSVVPIDAAQWQRLGELCRQQG